MSESLSHLCGMRKAALKSINCINLIRSEIVCSVFVSIAANAKMFSLHFRFLKQTRKTTHDPPYLN